ERPAARAVALDGDHVEARAPARATVLGEPRRRAAHEPRALARVDRLLRHAGAGAAPRLHLDEGDRAAARRDEVDLDAARAHVARHDPPAARREPRRRARLALGAERAPTGIALLLPHALDLAGTGRGRATR